MSRYICIGEGLGFNTDYRAATSQLLCYDRQRLCSLSTRFPTLNFKDDSKMQIHVQGQISNLRLLSTGTRPCIPHSTKSFTR